MATAGPDRPSVDVRILGPVRLLVDGHHIALSGAKPRALLAVLVVNRRRAVPKTVLLEAVWGDDPPPRAMDGLYAYVSNLRTVLRGAGIPDRDVLRTVDAGYLLDIADEQCDVGRFEAARARGAAAARDGDSRTAAACFAAALDEWSGAPLTGLDELAFAANFATDMTERRHDVLVDRIAADIADGRASAVIGELTATTAERTVDERVWRLLIKALYVSGRQADALTACLRLRRNLVRELGADPQPETVDLEDAVRNHRVPAETPSTRGATTRDLPNIRRRAWLRVGDGERIPVPPSGLRIGRESDNDIVLDDARVSRKHARILHRDDGIFIRDRDSANGVYVNEVPIRADTALSDGDVIRVGSTRLRYGANEEPASPA
ncbi:BTAD domain-containing putative transcriptional regulator [Nocardia bhagyanarayanae]|uniref:DNA-binding SARP family transcriptional activator n=1 Tax=Nocardia bhagyanarayanae TaxID=1215925 RepID=A0A543FCB1_9NOCA|nr:BTAD domain-containing putative transcriptional regulator [Nocardia bhagyanarayanae]TQM31467.1 DNA-binding SARP family transcriptional activator [Nocardia bhagyanarayanae]